jgi:hypothetical protein
MIVGRLGYDPMMVNRIIPEHEKLDEEYLISNVNYTIAVLFTGIRDDLQTAYNYFQCQRDEDDYQALRDNYGVGTPIEMPFVPFIRTRINYLIGSFLERPFDYKITCTDNVSLETIENEKKNEILKRAVDELNKHNKELLERLGEANKDAYSKTDFDKTISDLYEYIDTKWKSSFETAAQHILEYYKNGNLIIKLKRLLENLIISGSCHYKITIREIGVEPDIEIIDSREIYYHRNSNEFFMNKTDRVLRTRHMTRQEILNRYGHYMTEEDIEKIAEGYRITSMTRMDSRGHLDYRDHYEQSYPYDGYLPYNVLRVFEVEWIGLTEIEVEDREEVNNLYQITNNFSSTGSIKRYRQDLYRGVRIGYDIYCELGKVQHVPRSIDKPYECNLSFNGVSLDDYGKPYSLILKTKQLQDRYDIVTFLRENTVAHSGVKSDRIVLEHIPQHYGSTPEERIIKHIGYKKNGIDIISLSQEGAVDFNNYGQSSNLNLDVQTIQGYNLVLEMFEDLASKFIGVPKEMLGVIEERQAVGNVQMSSIKSTVVTLPLYFTHIQCVRQLLTDLLNVSKICFQEGKRGSYILGNKQKIFNIAEDSMLADYNVMVTEGINETKMLTEIKAMAMEFIKAQMIPAETAIELIMNQSLTDVKETTINKIEKAKEDQVKQLQQQFEQAQQQLKEYESKLKQFDELKAQETKAKIELDKQKFEFDKTVKEREFKLEEERLQTEKDIANKQLNTEILQLSDSNDKNDEPVNIKLPKL